MANYTYILINFFTIIICFIFSFDKRIQFYKHFKSFIIASTIVAIPFIIWDTWFTKIGVWWFNDTYLLGFRIFNLPIEEILFFFCIPFSCVFTYFCLTKFFKFGWLKGFNNIIAFITIIGCSVIAMLFHHLIYTFITCVVTVLTMIYLHFFKRAKWIGKASLIYCILMLGFFPVNGILTGTGLENPIVNYNPNDFLGIRMGTIPVEDAVYGYTMYMLNIYFFQLFQSKFKDKIDS